MPKVRITTKQLAKGLRPSKRSPRNRGILVECEGAVGRDGVLQALDEMARMATGTLTFPYPQLFVFTNMTIVCTATTIYEWVDGALVSQLVVGAGDPWRAVDFYDFIYMSNGVSAVVRDAGDKTYAVTTDLPIASAICNFNGQIIIGAPDVTVGA
jgi:hypothetical protein